MQPNTTSSWPLILLLLVLLLLGSQSSPLPGPTPPDPPTPVVTSSWTVLEESSSRTPARYKVIESIRDWLRAKNVRLLVVDPDIVNADGQPPEELRGVLDSGRALVAQGHALPLLFVPGRGSSPGSAVALPGSPADVDALMKRLWK